LAKDRRFESILQSVNKKSDIFLKYKDLVNTNDAVKSALQLSKKLYGYATPLGEANLNSPLHKGVSSGRLPYCTLSIALKKTFYASILPESLRGPTCTEIILPLLAAVFSLLGADKGVLYTRSSDMNVASYVKQTILVKDFLTSYPIELPPEGTSLSTRFDVLHEGVLQKSLSCIRQMAVSQIKADSVSDIGAFHFAKLVCAYTIASSFELRSSLTLTEVYAFLAGCVILQTVKQNESTITVRSGCSDRKLPHINAVTAISRFQIVASMVCDMAMLLGIKGDWVCNPGKKQKEFWSITMKEVKQNV